MPPRPKTAPPRSEIRSTRDAEGHNYIVIRFWDDGNKNWEYHVYSEVVAKEAARDVALQLGVALPPDETRNVRTLWEIVWNAI